MSLNLFLIFFWMRWVCLWYMHACVCGCTFWGQKRRLGVLFHHSLLYSVEVEFFTESGACSHTSLPPSLSPSFFLPPLPGECSHGVYVCETILPIELMYNLPSVWGWGKTKLERVIVCSVLSSRTKNRSQIFRMKIQYLFAVSCGDHFSFKWLKITHWKLALVVCAHNPSLGFILRVFQKKPKKPPKTQANKQKTELTPTFKNGIVCSFVFGNEA